MGKTMSTDDFYEGVLDVASTFMRNECLEVQVLFQYPSSVQSCGSFLCSQV